jgi:hypothetical protein
MNNKLQGEAPFAVERVETTLEVVTNNPLTCRSCQKCKHAYEEPQKVWSKIGRLNLEQKTFKVHNE